MYYYGFDLLFLFVSSLGSCFTGICFFLFNTKVPLFNSICHTVPIALKKSLSISPNPINNELLYLPQGEQKVKHFQMPLAMRPVFPLQTPHFQFVAKPANTVLERLKKTVYVITPLPLALGRSQVAGLLDTTIF